MALVAAGLAGAALLAGCSKLGGDKTASAKMPEFYMYAGKEYCLAEISNSEPDAVKRRDTTFDLLTRLFIMSRNGTERFNVVGVDYIDFKTLTLVVYSPCKDDATVKAVIDETGAVNKVFTGKQGGDAFLVSEAKVVEDYPGAIQRFAHFNPDVSPEVCLLHYTMPGAGQNAGRIANAVVRIASEFHFPIADFTSNGDGLFFLLARNCDQKDKVAEGIGAALKRRGIDVNSLIVRDPDAHFAEYQSLQPAAPDKK
jgi:hypothetical protein